MDLLKLARVPAIEVIHHPMLHLAVVAYHRERVGAVVTADEFHDGTAVHDGRALDPELGALGVGGLPIANQEIPRLVVIFRALRRFVGPEKRHVGQRIGHGTASAEFHDPGGAPRLSAIERPPIVPAKRVVADVGEAVPREPGPAVC